VIRQKTCFTADGKVCLGAFASAAARPTSCVPVRENVAVTNTEHTPLKPLQMLLDHANNVIQYILRLDHLPQLILYPK
jgi:hypothetical protein